MYYKVQVLSLQVLSQKKEKKKKKKNRHNYTRLILIPIWKHNLTGSLLRCYYMCYDVLSFK